MDWRSAQVFAYPGCPIAQSLRRRTKATNADPSEAQANAKLLASTNPFAATPSALIDCCVERASGSSHFAVAGFAGTAAVVSGSFITVTDPESRRGCGSATT